MSEISLKNVCCLCLSADRKLYHLCRILDGINLLYTLLTHDPEAYKEGFYREAASLLVCWECSAIINRIKRFQTQACVAQKHLTSIADGKSCLKLNTLSQLKVVHNTTIYELETNSTTTTENFVDCGPAIKEIIKSESDSDDIPLSAFRLRNNTNDFDHSEVTFEPDVQHVPLKNRESSSKTSSTLQKGSILPENSNNIHSKNSAKQLDNSTISVYSKNRNKLTKIKPTSKKKTKMKYSKYFSISTMSEEEMVQSVKTRQSDLVKYAAFTCNECFLRFETENELLHHNELHSKRDGYSECDVCHLYVQDFHTHRQSHYRSYTCVLCTHTDYSHTDMVTHLKHKHNDICFDTRKVSKRKRDRLTSDEPKYPCAECDNNFMNKDLRWKHIQKAHREGFKCRSCGKKFAFKNNLERHERIHSGALPREECPACHKMIRIDLLKVHSRIHADRQKHTCVECDKHFVSRESYESHLKYAQAHATGDVCRHACVACDKKYRSRGELQDHVNFQHKGEAAHKCPVCGKGLATKRCIRRHVRRVHEGIKENAKDKICQQCGKPFRDKKGLIEHERVHSGARPLLCRVCGRAFRQRAALYTHTRRLHATPAPAH